VNAALFRADIRTGSFYTVTTVSTATLNLVGRMALRPDGRSALVVDSSGFAPLTASETCDILHPDPIEGCFKPLIWTHGGREPMMEKIAVPELTLADLQRLPTEDDLPYDDGRPMETQRHVLQLMLLQETLQYHWRHRNDVYIGANMFVYYSLPQAELVTWELAYEFGERKDPPPEARAFRGPDFFVVLGVEKRERKSWVVWQEGKAPDVVIELLSASTAKVDKGKKKRIYQNELRVPEYFWYDPFSGELAGFKLHEGVYEPIPPDERGRLISRQLELALVRWEGVYKDVEACWLRWETLEGELLPTTAEVAEEERRRAEEERRRAEEERRRAEEAEALLARYRERFGELPE